MKHFAFALVLAAAAPLFPQAVTHEQLHKVAADLEAKVCADPTYAAACADLNSRASAIFRATALHQDSAILQVQQRDAEKAFHAKVSKDPKYQAAWNHIQGLEQQLKLPKKRHSPFRWLADALVTMRRLFSR